MMAKAEAIKIQCENTTKTRLYEATVQISVTETKSMKIKSCENDRKFAILSVILLLGTV